MFDVDFHILNQKATPAIYADTLAARPAAGFVGRLFVATDSPYGVFRDTGSAWVQVASNGGGGGGSTGVNGLNGTTNIGLGGTLTGNTLIELGSNNLNFNSNTNSGQISINSFFNWNFTDIGGRNYNFGADGIGSIDLDTTNAASQKGKLKLNGSFINTEFNNIKYGINLDFQNQRFSLGDYNLLSGKKNSIQIDDANSKIYFTTGRSSSNNIADLFYAENISSSVRSVKLGDFGKLNNGYSIQIDDGFPRIFSTNFNGDFGFIIDGECFFGAANNTDYCGLRISPQIQDVSFRTTGNAANGLFFNFNTGIYNFGDRLVNNTAIQINDPLKTISFTTDVLEYTGIPLEDPTPGVIATKALLINLNGTQYKINLY